MIGFEWVNALSVERVHKENALFHHVDDFGIDKFVGTQREINFPVETRVSEDCLEFSRLHRHLKRPEEDNVAK